MCKVSSLKSLSLQVVANFVRDVLKTKSTSTPLEQTLAIKVTNLMNSLDDCTFHVPFLNSIKKIAFVFQNVFNPDLLANTLWNNFKMKPSNLETTLNQLNEYLSLPPCLKLELARVLSTRYDSCNLSQMLLMIEMGLPCLDLQHYLRLTEDWRFIDLLKFGKKSVQKLILSDWQHHRFISIQTQQFLMTSFPYLQELTAHGTCCNDDTLYLVAKYCMHLKKVKVMVADGVTDQGIKFLSLSQSAAKQLVYLNLFGTKVTAKGAEIAMKSLARLETLQCSNDMDTIILLQSLLKQKLEFVAYKEILIIFTAEIEEKFNCKNLIHKLPLLFPNLCQISMGAEVPIEPERFQDLRSLSKITRLIVGFDVNLSESLFPCDNDRTNLQVHMNNLTHLTLRILWDVCIQSVLASTPSLKYLDMDNVMHSTCTHAEAVTSSVSHVVIADSGAEVVGKILGLCPRIKTLALLKNHGQQLWINGENLTNLTHLSLDCLKMNTAAFLVKNCKNLQLLNLTNQLPVSKKAAEWFHRRNLFVKVTYSPCLSRTWFEDVKFSPC